MNETIIKELKAKKLEFLGETLLRCLNKEPKLSLKEIAMVIGFEVGPGLEEFLKEYKKEIKAWLSFLIW